jgi:hypothetical protein
MPPPISVQVVEALHQPTTYKLHYEFASKDGDYPLLDDSHLDPESELTVMVMDGVVPRFLASGPVTGQDISIPDGGSGVLLDVHGGDHCVSMDREDKGKIWSNVTDSLAVTKVLVDNRLVPDVGVTTTLHTEFTHVLVQRESDLRFVRRLARRNGFWFWITSEAPMVNVAHFKRFKPGGTADVELKINARGSNVDRVTLEWDSERPVSAPLKQLDLATKSVMTSGVDKSPLTGLAAKALGDVVSSTRSAHIVVPVDSAGDLAARAEALLIDHGWFVSARVVTRYSTLKKIVRAHTVASLAGVGKRHSGNYVVARVVHDIDENDHVMTIDLVRNAWN